MTGKQLYEAWAGEDATDVAFGVWDDLTEKEWARWNRLASRFALEEDLALVQADVDAAAQEWGLGDETEAQAALDRIRAALRGDR